MIWVALGAGLEGKIGETKQRKKKQTKQNPVGITWVKVGRQKRKNSKETCLYTNFSTLGSPP